MFFSLKRSLMALLAMAILVLFTPLVFAAETIDSIFVVVDDVLITQSDCQRVLDNLSTRKDIAGNTFYTNEKYSLKEIAEQIIDQIVVSKKMDEMGRPVSDEDVMSRIDSTQVNMNLTKVQFHEFLKEKNISFSEYKELIRSLIQYHGFVSKVVVPLVSVSEQEVKNSFFQKNAKNKTLALKYTLIDFAISTEFTKTSEDRNNFQLAMKEMQAGRPLHPQFSTVVSNILGDITEDGLSPELQASLKTTDEGSFTAPILLHKETHVFFVKKKDLVESELFTREKEDINKELFETKIKQMTTIWLNRERGRHFIKRFY